MRETRTVRTAGGTRGGGSAGRRGRGIASGAKIRFARCRLHPRSIATHLYPPARRLHSNHPERATRFPSTSPRGPLLYPLSPHPPLPLPLSRSATVPRKLERAPPFDPADSHPPSHPTTNHPSVDLTPSPMAPRSFPFPLPTKRIQLLPTVSFSATTFLSSRLVPVSTLSRDAHSSLSLSLLFPFSSLFCACYSRTPADKYATGGPRDCRCTCVATRQRIPSFEFGVLVCLGLSELRRSRIRVNVV